MATETEAEIFGIKFKGWKATAASFVVLLLFFSLPAFALGWALGSR